MPTSTYWRRWRAVPRRPRSGRITAGWKPSTDSGCPERAHRSVTVADGRARRHGGRGQLFHVGRVVAESLDVLTGGGVGGPPARIHAALQTVFQPVVESVDGAGGAHARGGVGVLVGGQAHEGVQGLAIGAAVDEALLAIAAV